MQNADIILQGNGHVFTWECIQEVGEISEDIRGSELRKPVE